MKRRLSVILVLLMLTGLLVPALAEAPVLEGNLYKTGTPIVEEMETYTIMAKKAGLSKTAFPDKPAVLAMEEMTNIHIQWQEIAASGWTEKVNLSFASNDLPDAIISGMDTTTVMQNIDALVPIGDYVDEYAPAIKALWEARPDIKAALTTPDGKIYSFNSGEESAWTVTNSLLLVNKTWLDALGLEIPTTTQEFMDMLQAFKDNDMNGNGNANDEIPFSFCQQDSSYRLDSLFGAFGVLDNDLHLMVEDGAVYFPASTDAFRTALDWMHSLSANDLLDNEGFSQTLEQLQAKGKNAEPLLGAFISYNADTATGTNMNDYVPIAPLDGGLDKVLWNREGRTGGNLTGFVVTTKCASPETLVRWHDTINSSWENKMLWSFGPEGMAWKFNDSGLWIQNNDNLPEGASWGEYRQSIAPGPSGNWFMMGEETLFQRELAARTQVRLDAIVDLYQAHFPEERLQANYEDADIAVEKNLLKVEIDAYLATFVANSVLKGVTDAQWEEHLKACRALEVERYVTLWQEYYDSQK